MQLTSKASHMVIRKMDCLVWIGRLSKALTKNNMCDNLQEFQVQHGLELVSNQFGKGGLNVY